MIADKIWNLTNAVHLTLTEWKPIVKTYFYFTTQAVERIESKEDTQYPY